MLYHHSKHRSFLSWPHPIVFGLLFSLFPFSASAQSLPDSLTLQTPLESVVFSEADVALWFHLSTELRYDTRIVSEIENTDACPIAEMSYCDSILPRRLRSHTIVVFNNTINEEALRASVVEAAKELDENPVNAILTAKDGFMTVETPEQPGFASDADQATTLIRTTLSQTGISSIAIDMPGTVLEPAVKGSDIERLGIRELIAEGTTNFAGSPKNRIFNINHALKQFQGVLIAPGAEFSFVEQLGPVDGEHGYLPELVIKNNKTEPEFGGGICQVSSTVFRTAIYGGLKITERRNHAYPVSYYRPYGMDATIYIPKPDLRFQNNTPGYIFLQPSVSGTRLTFQMYGTNDGRKVEIDGPHILESNPDGSMRTIFTQTVNNADDQNFIRDSFRSNYKSPSLFPHPGDEILKEKPADWSKRQWSEYQKTHAR